MRNIALATNWKLKVEVLKLLTIRIKKKNYTIFFFKK